MSYPAIAVTMTRLSGGTAVVRLGFRWRSRRRRPNKREVMIMCQLAVSLAWIAHATVVEAMAAAGQKLAVQWGHQPWSDSWAKLVAETLVDALTVIDGGWIREAVVTGPDALFCGDCMAPAHPGCDYSGHGVTTLGELMEAYR